MAIRGGQILHDIRGFVIDRIQTGGVSSFNIPQDPVYELGNFQKVETIRDIPTLTFDINSLDVSTEMEAVITHVDPTTVVSGQEFDFGDYQPLDVLSPWKATKSSFTIDHGVVVPYLTLSSVQYQFGINANATEQFTFQGDTLYFTPGVPFTQSYSLVGGTSHAYSLSHTAQQYVESGDTFHVLSACIHNLSTGAYKRLFFASDGTLSTGDYTDTTGTVTVLKDWTTDGFSGGILEVVYSTSDAITYPQALNTNASVKPGAVRGKDICVTVYTGAATPVAVKWTGVQSIQVTRNVNLEADDELCNPKHVDYSYDVPDVTGNVVVKPFDADDLQTKIAQIANIGTTEVAGPYSSAPLQVEIQIKHPDTGVVLKTLYIPDARFTLPAFQGQSNTKASVTFPFTSDGGQLLVYQGERP